MVSTSSSPKHYASLHLVTLLIGLFHLFTFVDAALYVVDPRDRTVCKAGKPCTVTWLDDGRAPLLSAIGVSTVGLYTGTRQIVQALPPIDVSQTLSFTFTPNAAAGPNSGAYYISFTSTESFNGTEPYSFYSPWFRLEDMTGSFDSPRSSLTRTQPIPTSLTQTTRTTTSRLSTITVGTLSTSITDGITISLPSPTTTRSGSPSSPTATSPSGSSSTSNTGSASPASASTTALGNAALRSRKGGLGVYVSLGVALVVSAAAGWVL